ncbi:hypothetical protein NIES4071_20560 [Calothrix sp. NIES-4071]|nr:hypothetical protein NIES4071_20560 [Calothrix sp. NIES-4071]BAZ56388.1 hypothetical protein NIES4105_20510 [Calothrix sp. NIES-4105]
MVTLQLKQIKVLPGQRVILEDISWQEFEAILDELGKHRNSRVAYSQGTLEIMVPLPEHEKPKVIIGDLVKILLKGLDLYWESLGQFGKLEENIFTRNIKYYTIQQLEELFAAVNYTFQQSELQLENLVAA